MERNNIIASPETDTYESLYQIWQNTHIGSKKDFYRFMTTPTVDRDMFMNTVKKELRYTGNVVEEFIMA